MRLLTDYTQWYDAIFDATGPVFHRMAFTRGGLSRADQYGLFTRIGLATPRHGIVRELATAWLSEPRAAMSRPEAALERAECIVYHDPWAHRGEGKERMSLARAAAEFPAAFAAMYHPAASEAVSFRWVRFGRLEFWIEQCGSGIEWRSNVRESERVLSRGAAAGPSPIPRVLWAIDWIPGPGGLLATDFNTAPDLTILGEQGALSREEVAEELEEAYRDRPRELEQF